jgi:Mrp family chromosome partitioning ATPase
MPAGTRCLEAAGLLATDRGRQQLRRLIRRFAYTVVSAPSVAVSTDGSLLGSLADGVVIVVNEPSMRTRRLAAVAGQLESAGARVVGAVLHAPRSRLLGVIKRWF